MREGTSEMDMETRRSWANGTRLKRYNPHHGQTEHTKEPQHDITALKLYFTQSTIMSHLNIQLLVYLILFCDQESNRAATPNNPCPAIPRPCNRKH